MGIVIAIALFSAIVLFHELGHFLFAKYHKVKVEEFALGLGPTIVGKQIGETKYSIKLLPFGGCCMMKGEEDPSDQEDDSFSAKSPLARISILFAGPMFNFIFAFVTAFFLILAVGTDLPVAGPVEEGSAAYEAGIREGDEIISLDGDRITNFRELSLYNVFHQKDPEVTVLYERDGQEFTTEMLRTKNEKGQYQMGIMSSGYTRVSPAQVLPRNEASGIQHLSVFKRAVYRSDFSKTAFRSGRHRSVCFRFLSGHKPEWTLCRAGHDHELFPAS